MDEEWDQVLSHGAGQKSRRSYTPWIVGLIGLLAVAGVAAFFDPFSDDQEDDEKTRLELIARIDRSKIVFSATNRDRVLSDVIDESMKKQYYDIASDAASYISMPMIRRQMYKRIAEHCIMTRGKRAAQSCVAME